MSALCPWLPPLITVEQYAHDWQRYVDGLYRHFEADFVASRPTCGSRKFGLKRLPIFQNREATFWHLLTEGDIETTRTYDEIRCARIKWPRAIIDAVGTHRLMYWQSTRKGNRYIVLGLPDFSYVVVLADRGKELLLWTAYPVETNHRRKSLEREWQVGRLATPW